MKTYKRSLVELIKGIVIALVTGIAASVIIRIFTRSALLGLGVPALLTIALLYIALFSENVFLNSNRTACSVLTSGGFFNTPLTSRIVTSPITGKAKADFRRPMTSP